MFDEMFAMIWHRSNLKWRNLRNVFVYRNFVVEVHRKTDSVLNNQIKQPTAQVQSIGYDSSALVRELQEGFNAVRRDVSFATQTVNKMQAATCPNIPCLTTTTFIIFAIVQIFILVGYFYYRFVFLFNMHRVQKYENYNENLDFPFLFFCRDSKENQAKKFY